MKIGVVGLGLIGGSIFKDLVSETDIEVVAVSKSQSGQNIHGYNNIYGSYEVLKDCEIVFVCTHMNNTVKILEDLEKFLSPETIVTDVCSLKEFVSKKTYNYCFIPSHPMAGTEKKGFENSLEGLFRGASWVLTPLHGTSDEKINKLTEIIVKLGATPIFSTPKAHDEAAAMISHMPMLIAQALFLAAEDSELAIKMASSGFRDMTRLALSNEEMANDMIYMNHENIQIAILKLYKAVGDLTSGNYLEKIKKIKEHRSKMFH